LNLEDIAIGTRHEFEDAEKAALLIMDPDQEGIITFWAQYAYQFLSAYILHLLYKSSPTPVTLSTISNHLMELPSDVLFNEMLSCSSKTVNEVALTLLNEPESFHDKFVKTALTAIQDYQKRAQLYPAI
jgi:hypothetical protein